jgi:NADH-quinone oxidoreductase subunit G
VNWSWLCDKGRFGFEAGNSESRLSEPLLRNESGELVPARWSEALDAAASAISAAVASRGPASIAVLGGARLTNESAYAWAKLAKGVIGTDNTDAQLGDGLPAEFILGLPGASIDEVCEPGGTVLYLGPDPKETLPILFLRLRHAAERDGVKIIEVGPTHSGLSPYAHASITARPGETDAVVAALLDGTSEHGPASDAIRSATNLRVVVGRANLAESPAVTIRAANKVREAVPGSTFLPAIVRGNVRGAIEAGLAPGLLPGGAPLDGGIPKGWDSVPAAPGGDATQILNDAANGRIEVLILLGSDPVRDFPERSLVRRALAGAKTVVSVDPFVNASAEHADIVLAAAMFTEVEGTTTNMEGRVSSLNQKVTPPGTARTDWMLAVDLADRLGADLGVSDSVDDLLDEFAANSALVPAADEAKQGDGVRLAVPPRSPAPTPEVVIPTSNAYSLRLVINHTMYDHGTLLAESPSSASLAGESVVRLSAADSAPLGVTDGTPVKVTSEHGAVSLPAMIDRRVPKGVAVMHQTLGDVDPGGLIDSADAVCDVRVEVS